MHKQNHRLGFMSVLKVFEFFTFAVSLPSENGMLAFILGGAGVLLFLILLLSN